MDRGNTLISLWNMENPGRGGNRPGAVTLLLCTATEWRKIRPRFALG
jgi:hypothetical protein